MHSRIIRLSIEIEIGIAEAGDASLASEEVGSVMRQFYILVKSCTPRAGFRGDVLVYQRCFVKFVLSQ